MTIAGELRWNACWAELVGVDGHLVTDLVGRQVPALTDELIEAMRQTEIQWSDRFRVTSAVLEAHKIADRNGVRVVAAAARQSAERAANVHIVGERNTVEWSDSFHRTMAARHAAEHTALALVVRQHAPTELVDLLSHVWCTVMGPLRELIPLKPAKGDCACGRPPGDVVFAADAAAQVRNVQAGVAMSIDVLNAELAAFKSAARECGRRHIVRVDVARAVRAALDEAPRLPQATRAWLEKRLGLMPSGTPHQVVVNAGPYERPLVRDCSCPIGVRHLEDDTVAQPVALLSTQPELITTVDAGASADTQDVKHHVADAAPGAQTQEGTSDA